MKWRMMASAMIAIAATSCANHMTYQGVSLRPGVNAEEVSSLAQRAKDGDKQAQLALGIRFETGDGVRLDHARARALYRLAASDSGGTQIMHIPRRGGGITSVPISSGAKKLGLEEAQCRLARLEARDIEPRCRKYIM